MSATAEIFIVNMEIRYFCPACSAYNRLTELPNGNECQCSSCKKIIPLQPCEDFRQRGEITRCEFCGHSFFHHRSDFNKGLGCAILLVAIVFSVWTYGMSLVVAAGIDWILFKRLPPLVVCYICDTEYKGTKTIAPEFDLHLHEKYKKLREAYASKNG